MNRTRMPAWRTTLTLAIAITLGAGFAWAGDVTVVGSSRPCLPASEFDGAKWLDVPPVPSPDASPWLMATDGSTDNTSSAQGHQPEQSAEPNDEISLEPALPMFTRTERPGEAAWYARFDYFVWNERSGGVELLREDGTLYTLGCVRCSGFQRLRLEMFTGSMVFGGEAAPLGDPVSSSTTYLGFRGEYEWLWDINFHGCPRMSLFAGIGTRFWIRDMKDGTDLTTNTYSVGYQEIWWTLYPYIGLEKSWTVTACTELFVRGRLGCTAATTNSASFSGTPTIYPEPGITAQAEIGLRHEQIFALVYFEAMTWQASTVASGWYQPQSNMFTTGLQLGLSF